MGHGSIPTTAAGSQTGQKTDSVMGSVPYFRDDAGKNTQAVDGYLYRVKCNGSKEAVRLTSAVMPGQRYGGSYYLSYKSDLYEYVLCLIQLRDKEENLYFRLDQEGNITPAEEICEIMAPYVEAAAEWGTDDEGWESILLEENCFFLSEEGIGLHFDAYEIGRGAGRHCALQRV